MIRTMATGRIFATTKGKVAIAFEGYAYRLDKRAASGIVYFRCLNDCEGWHNRFNRAVSKHHPNIWHLLNCIRDEESSVRVVRNQLAAGHAGRRNNRKYLSQTSKLTVLRKRYQDGEIDVIQLITGISHSLAFNTK
jgi:hypothetical protein